MTSPSAAWTTARSHGEMALSVDRSSTNVAMVGLFGGTLQAGPDAGGFRVIARLPVEEAAASTPAERDPGVSA